MQTHVIAMRDSQDCSYRSIVLAPDAETARRVFAARMLTDTDRTLAGEGESTLTDFAAVSLLDEEWQASQGENCPSCGTQDVTSMENRDLAVFGASVLKYGKAAKTCNACAHGWIILGTVVATRRRLETEALDEIAGLDEFEAASAMRDAA